MAGEPECPVQEVRAFYGTMVASLLIGMALTLLPVGPIRLLFVGSIAGGIATPVTLAIMMRAAQDRKVMGRHRIGWKLAVGGWLVTAVVTVAVGIFLWQTVTGG